MSRLGLADPRWAELEQRDGAAVDTASRLAHLLEHPEDASAFSELCPHLCSEGTTYSAGHAAFPYVVDLAEKRRPGTRLAHLAFIGMAVIGTGTTDGVKAPASIRPEIADAYAEALPRALRLAAEELLFQHGPSETRDLLAAVAALKGYPKIGDVVQALDALLDCPACGAAIEAIEG